MAPRLRHPEPDFPRHPGQPPGGKAGIGVLLLDRGREPAARRPPHDRPGGIAPGADHDPGPLEIEEPVHLANQPHGEQGPPEVLPPLAPVDRLRREQVVGELAGGKQASLHPTARARQDYSPVGVDSAQRARDGEGGHQVATGAAAGDEDGQG